MWVFYYPSFLFIRSKVRVRVRAEDQGRVISCEADNGLGVTVATNITLDVLRKCLPHSRYTSSFVCIHRVFFSSE